MPRDSRRRVLARVMSYEYLWHTIREVGGAYGTGMLRADGIEFLYTYRDPHLRESYDTFANAPAALAARDYTARDLDEFIVGTAAKLDTPRKARAAARELDHRYFCGITEEMRAADRKALCSVDAALLKAQAAALVDVLSGGVRVAFDKDAVEAAKDSVRPGRRCKRRSFFGTIQFPVPKHPAGVSELLFPTHTFSAHIACIPSKLLKNARFFVR